MTHDSRLMTGYMHRCLALARLGAGYVAPNPMVGAVLVYEGKIIGEGYHQRFGEAHAEVNCIADAQKRLAAQSGMLEVLQQSTLYVSLEPCAHFGKTPPCADLIIKSKIPRVVIGCYDPFERVDGKAIKKMNDAGIIVDVGILEMECKELNKRFFTFQTKHRPYIILKWAQTADGKIAGPYWPLPNPPPTGEGEATTPASKKKETSYQEHSSDKQAMRAGKAPSIGVGLGDARLLISNEYTNRLVHKWRSEEASIMVGTNTALCDDPELTNRLWPGRSPIRLVVDMDLKLPSSLKVFNDKAVTIVFNKLKHSINKDIFSPMLQEVPDPGNDPDSAEGAGNGTLYYQVTKDSSVVHQIVNALYKLRIQSVLVEGGARLLQSFIDENMWDEARVITNSELRLPGEAAAKAGITHGLSSPVLNNGKLLQEDKIESDLIKYLTNQLNQPIN